MGIEQRAPVKYAPVRSSRGG